MKKTVTLIEKLIRLANGDTLPVSSLKGDWFEQMQTDGILVAVTHGSRKGLRVAGVTSFRHYVASQYDIRDLEQTHELLSKENVSRAEQVVVTGDSKFHSRRTFTGFLVNSYQPIDAVLNGKLLTIFPPQGCCLFVADYQHFCVSEDVVIIGVENAENFLYIEHQKYLFKGYKKVLFVSRYPQEQSKDLLKWLQSIPNQYIHFGDLDLAGIAIYENEYYCHLGERASFFVPLDFEQRISEGSLKRYNVQYNRFGNLDIKDLRLQNLLSCIHHYHKGYDQEGFLLK